MCEIGFKRKSLFKLEFFTAHEITPGEWMSLVMERLLHLEQVFNESGAVRVHVHEIDDHQKEVFSEMLLTLERQGKCRQDFHDLAYALFNDRLEA